MEVLLFVLFFLLILFFLILGHTIPVYKSHKKATGGIINHDPAMRKFVFKVNASSDDIIGLLKNCSEADELSCTFDFDRSIIKISEYGSHREYYYQIQECNGFSIFSLEQVASIGMKSTVPYKINPFMVSKLQAEIIPFSKYGF